ncbi:hypothetical protein DT075_21605 [Bacillus licheniformis]|nr:hypothetical protein DT075_21605 [Bacillus licheniformis]
MKNPFLLVDKKELRIVNRSFTVEKVLNNNVLIALHDDYREVVLIGKGIGFGKKRGDLIEHENYEKMFILENDKVFRLLQKRIGGAGPEKLTVPYKLIKRATV